MRRRAPLRLAGLGAVRDANRPTFCCSSLSTPSSPSRDDSAEPFCTNQTVAAMKRENWRNSDCQFSITAPPKLGEVTYAHQESASPPRATCSAFSAR